MATPSSRSGESPEELRRFYKEDRFRVFFDWAARFKNDVSKTTLDTIERELRRDVSGVTRTQVLEFCKDLERIGCGTFVLGRRGHPSRMEWRWTIRSIGAFACSQADDIEIRESEDQDEAPEQHQIRIELPLRRGSVLAILVIPQSLSAEEADYLCSEIRLRVQK